MQKMWENTKEFFKKHWKLFSAVAGPVILLVIIFSLPIKVVPVEVTENYTALEIQSQPYVARETYQENESYTDSETATDTVYDSYTSGYNWNYSFVPRPNSTISVSVSGMGYSYPPFIYRGDNSTGPFFPGGYLNFYSAGSRIVIKMTYPIVKNRLVSKTREVIKYKDVQVPVQKERVVTRTYRMSLWAFFFMDQSKLATSPQ
jgi:hypothetical protein